MTKKLSKQCSKCKICRDINDFHKSAKGKFGHVSVCKLCRHKLAQENATAKAEYDKAYRQTNHKHIVEYAAAWRANNKDKVLEYQQRYRKKHKDKVKAAATKYISKRLKTNINVRLAHNIRKRMYRAIKNSRVSAIKHLGCSMAKLRIHLELGFHRNAITGEMMTWDNYGQWHIDHIRPLVSFDLTNSEQFKVACHYTNLQPLWAEDNLSKGGSYDN